MKVELDTIVTIEEGSEIPECLKEKEIEK